MKLIKHALFLTIIITTVFSCKNPNSELLEQQRLDQERAEQLQEQQRAKEAQAKIYIQSINTVLLSDSAAGKTSNGDYTLQTRKMRAINTSQCPRDFAVAYLNHIHAWENFAKVMKARALLAKQGDGAVAAGIFATLTEMEASPFSDYLKAEKELNRLAVKTRTEITTTWHRIELLTVNYGGSLPD